MMTPSIQEIKEDIIYENIPINIKNHLMASELSIPENGIFVNTISHNTLVQKLCLGEIIPFNKPQAYYETLKYVNTVGDINLKPAYHYADNPMAAWEKIYDIRDAKETAMNYLLDFS